ncbi:MAG: AzlD domain-containing protein [Pseudomonadota bacterium]
MSDLFSAPGYTLIDAWWWPYLFVLLVGFLPTEIWRVIGVFLAGDLEENSPILVWVRAVATALVAAVIAKLVLFPTGALATTPVALRVGAAATGFAVFKFSGDRVAAGVIAAEAILIGGWLMLGT